MTPNILFIDIETTPNVVHSWGLFNQTIGLSQLIEPSRLLCFSAKWKGDRKPFFFSDAATRLDVGPLPRLVDIAHGLMSDADLIVHYNGLAFDIPILNAEFVQAGLAPPAPSKHIDLYRVAKKNFRFPSGKLDYITRALGLEGKLKHSGHDLWVRCMAGEPKAWQTMMRYNMRDVTLLEKLYKRLLPWISNHPSLGLFTGRDGCRNCGSTNLRKEGFSYTDAGKFQRYQCRACSAWSKSPKRMATTSVRGAA